VATYASVAIVIFLAVSWLLSKRDRKKLEDKYIK
jgi:predicted Zn-dependent protease